MATVIVANEISFDAALKKWKRKCNEEGLMQEIRKREFYVSPAVKKREKRKAAQRKQMIAERKNRTYY